MRVLVTAATKYGATAEVAQMIAEVLADRGLEPTVVPPEQVEGVDGYDAVVLGSAVYAGHWRKPARELVNRCGTALAERPVWLFSSGPVGDPSPRRTPSTWPSSSPPPGPGSTGCWPASWSAGSSASPTGRSSRPYASPRETSATGPRSPAGRPASPTPCRPSRALACRRVLQLVAHPDRWTGTVG